MKPALFCHATMENYLMKNGRQIYMIVIKNGNRMNNTQEQIIDTLYHIGLIETLGFKLLEGYKGYHKNCWFFKNGRLMYYYITYDR